MLTFKKIKKPKIKNKKEILKIKRIENKKIEEIEKKLVLEEINYNVKNRIIKIMILCFSFFISFTFFYKYNFKLLDFNSPSFYEENFYLFENIANFFKNITNFEILWNYVLLGLVSFLKWLLTYGLILIEIIFLIFVLLKMAFETYLDKTNDYAVESKKQKKALDFYEKISCEFKKIKIIIEKKYQDYKEEIYIILFIIFYAPLLYFVKNFLVDYFNVLFLNDGYEKNMINILMFIPTLYLKIFELNSFFGIIITLVIIYKIIDFLSLNSLKRKENKYYAEVESEFCEHSGVSGKPGTMKTLKSVLDTTTAEEIFYEKIIKEKEKIQRKNYNYNFKILDDLIEHDIVFKDNYVNYLNSKNSIIYDEQLLKEIKKDIDAKENELSFLEKEKEIEQKEQEIENLKSEKRDALLSLENNKEIFEKTKKELSENYSKIDIEKEEISRYLFLTLKTKQSLIFSNIPVVSKIQSNLQGKIVYGNELTKDELTLNKGVNIKHKIDEYYLQLLDEYEVALADEPELVEQMSRLYCIISQITNRKYKTVIITQKRKGIDTNLRTKMDLQKHAEEKVVIKYGWFGLFRKILEKFYKIFDSLLIRMNYEEIFYKKSDKFYYKLKNYCQRTLFYPVVFFERKLAGLLEKTEIERGFFKMKFLELSEIDAGQNVKEKERIQKIPVRLSYLKINGIYNRLYETSALNSIYERKGVVSSGNSSLSRENFYDEKNLFNTVLKKR